MKSAMPGKSISEAEVTNISKHGFWLLLADEELFVAFKKFPWFKAASVEEIVTVEWAHPHHLYWPELDIDLAVESIRHPEKFPLLSKVSRQAKRPSRRAMIARAAQHDHRKQSTMASAKKVLDHGSYEGRRHTLADSLRWRADGNRSCASPAERASTEGLCRSA